MIYTQILALMMALVLVTGAPISPEPLIAPAEAFFLWIAKAVLWSGFSLVTAARSRSTVSYSRNLDRLQWATLILLATDFYSLDLKTYLVAIPGSSLFPSLIEIAGLGVYMLYLLILWSSSWMVLKGRGLAESTLSDELWGRLRFFLPALILYLAIAFFGDAIGLIPSARLHDFMDSTKGQILFFILVIVLLLFFVPPMVCRIWNCTSFPDGVVRRLIEQSLHRMGLSFADIKLWPLSGKRSCTAAVLGIVPRWRYILLTPCLLEHLYPDEIEAVMSHEAAHVRHRHLLWYVFFIGAYSMILYQFLDPVWVLLLSHRSVVNLLFEAQGMPSTYLSLLAILPLGLMMILYFRFLIGYFMRNFERQADLAVFEVQGEPGRLISSLEKIAALAEGIRNQPNWHHFSIAERIDFLRRAAGSTDAAKRFEKRLRASKAVFIAIALLFLSAPLVLPVEKWEKQARTNLAEVSIDELMKREERSLNWYLAVGQLFYSQENYLMAEKVYQKAVGLFPEEPEVLNELAWLYATSKDPNVKKPREALMYASEAARRKAAPHILDTLAESLFINGYTEKALEVEREALKKDPAGAGYYKEQLKRFEKALRQPPSGGEERR